MDEADAVGDEVREREDVCAGNEDDYVASNTAFNVGADGLDGPAVELPNGGVGRADDDCGVFLFTELDEDAIEAGFEHGVGGFG